MMTECADTEECHAQSATIARLKAESARLREALQGVIRVALIPSSS